ERGERVPSLETLIKISNAVGIEPFELLFPQDNNGSSISPRFKPSTELYHRVKNHFQMIRSYFRLQKSAVEGNPERINEILDKGLFILTSVVELYERLSKLETGEHVNVKEFFGSTLEKIESTLPDNSYCIVHEIDVPQEVTIPSTDAITCTLILIELIMNAHEHAHLGNGDKITVHFDEQAGGGFVFEVRDSGTGTGEFQFDMEQSEISGLALVKELVVHDLHGT
ncbi:MAG: histidine kinase dimerization/phosphoacceptor domain -containing protein, partial [bacterium]